MAVMTALNVVHDHLRQSKIHRATVTGIEETVRRLEQKVAGAVSRRRQPEAVD
jgi:cell division protein ZapA (FtsZ GTPase activity inhibitor)